MMLRSIPSKGLVLMRRSQRFEDYNHRLAATIALSATAAAATLAAVYATSNDFSQSYNNNDTRNSNCSQIKTTFCDVGLLSSPFASLTRQQTIEYFDRTAQSKNALQTRYILGKEAYIIGVGSFGAVEQAICRETNQPVAIKRLPKESTSHIAVQRELQALLAIREAGGHPNLTALREHFDDDSDDAYYLVMDLVPGGELFDALCTTGPLSEADAARFCRQLGSALQFLHAIGLVHADVKPENCILSEPNAAKASVKLVDFGCCQPATTKEIAHSILQARLLTQTPEWHKHIQHLSTDVRDMLKRLMHPDPNKRYTAEDLLNSPWVRGLTASSQKMSPSDHRIAAYKLHQTRVAAQFFKRMLQHRTSHGNDARALRRGSATEQKQSLLEAAFAQLDQAGRGYISSKELHGDTSWLGADAKLSLPEATELLSQTHMKDHYFPAGHIIYHEGDPGDVMYFIQSGVLKAESKDGFVKDKRAGDFFGEDVLGDSDTNAYAFTARCITPVHAIQILRKEYNKYIAQDEDLALIMKEHGRIRRHERAQVLLGMEKKTKTKIYTQGDILFERGSSGDDSLYVLLEGDVDISVDGHKVRSLRKGEMTGEHAAYYGSKPYNVTAQCMSDACTLGVLAGKELRKALAKNPVLQESFHDIIMRRDFKKALCAHLNRPFPETEKEIKEAFDALVPLTDNEDAPRELELGALKKLMKSFDPTYPDEEIVSMLSSLDLNSSESLTWSEFKAIFTMD